jgi:hypothetical protein
MSRRPGSYMVEPCPYLSTPKAEAELGGRADFRLPK